MPVVQRLTSDLVFPAAERALDEPNGLLAVGGDLSPARLLAAYRRGIFPWYEEPQPILWWSPDPRSVLFPQRLHISRSLRKTLRADGFTLSVDRDFTRVMRECAELRGDGLGTWIDEEMIRAYSDLHRMGYGHSVEVRTPSGELVGGLYGLAIGRVFFGESMFSKISDASKVALVALVDILTRGGFELIDCQVESNHLNSMGACNIPRPDFEHYLAGAVNDTAPSGIWRLPASCGGLL
jgi:leucyl/phenylalanyl-tRNA--protein transferase